MKNIIIYVLLICPFWINAQQDTCGLNAKGYSTNPDAPINPECDSINTFDWRAERWPAPYYSGAETDGRVPSPFFNDGNGAIEEIHNETFGGKDFETEDGWELIVDGVTKKQGNLEDDLDIIYVVLYNKYTANLRVFGAHNKDNFQYSYIAVNMNFYSTSDNFVRGLFHPTLQIAQSLDEKSITEVHRNGRVTEIDERYFFYADFPIGYDPCTCFSPKEGQIDITFSVVQEQDLELYGRTISISRTLESISGNQTGLNKDFLTNLYSIDGHAEAGSQTFKTLEELTDYYGDLKTRNLKITEQYKAIQNLKTMLELAASLTPLAPIAPIIGTITTLSSGDKEKLKEKAMKKAETIEKSLKVTAKFTDVLSGSLKSKKDAAASAVDVIGSTRIISSEMAFKGEITTELPLGDFSFFIPGQPNNADEECSNSRYPMYNEVLGRFALLETPKVNVGDVNTEGGIFRRINFDASSFKYIFNPAAKVNEENTQMFGALVVKSIGTSVSGLHQYNISKVESLSGEDTTIHISPFVSIDCLENLTSQFREQTRNTESTNYEIYLRLII